MKHLLQIIATIAVAALCACSSDEMERNFKNPSEKVQTAVYWYWISGNISKEGVVADLHAMKRAGINRAFIGDIGQDGLYTERNIKIFSDEWWEVLHTALKTASELDIEIGIFNSPGWSQSGGPWVKPEEAMRYLAASEHYIKGGEKISLLLDIPAEPFQHVSTIAYPAPKGYGETTECEVTPADITALKSHETNIVEMKYKEPVTVRSLTINPTHTPMLTTAYLDANIGGEWQRIASQHIDRSNPALNVGFTPFAPIVLSFEATTAAEFRLTMTPTHLAGGITKLSLSPVARIANYAEKSLAKMCQTPLPYWNHYMWEKQPATDSDYAINPDKVIDLTKSVSDNTLNWDAPEGEWIVLHTGMTPTGVTNSPATPEATGLEIDKLSSKHTKRHFDAFIGEILRRIPEKDRTTFKVVVQDSYETGGQNFTDNMMAEFESTYGYSMLPYLPTYYGYTVGSNELSDRFLWDLRRFIADRVAYQYVGGLKEASNSHGLTTWLECYGHWGFPGEFLQYGGQSDEIGGEFWSVGELGDIENRAASSCGHIYGKRKIWAESNTSGGPAYSRSPIDMKQRTDRFFTEGINATLLHLYIEQADTARYPGINAWFGNEFDGHNTWYSHLDLFTTYLKRCNYMLQQGINIADVAYLIGEDAPKMTGLQHPALPKGYQFDYINAEVLMLDANVAQGGNITLPHGTTYRLLVLPPQDNMRPELLSKIKRMVSDGAVILGTPPLRSPSLQNYPKADNEVEKMSRELWGECFSQRGVNNYGKGRVYNGYSLEEVFAELDLAPDCSIEPAEPLLYCHRSTMGAEIYFISNQSNEPITISPTFRVQRNMHPEFWDATNGEIEILPDFTDSDKGIEVPIRLEALGSGFVVFRKPAIKPTAGMNTPQPASVATINNGWHLQFDGKLSSPADIELKRLTDLSQNKDSEVKYFSGTINYTTSFTAEQATRTVLDFERVECMAKVYVNGEYAGGVWCEPFKVDITDYITEGENTLRVEVVNKWVNRIVGDMQLPAEERKISLTANPYNASSAIPASGLIGEVRLEYYE